jgi:hypothetical protein
VPWTLYYNLESEPVFGIERRTLEAHPDVYAVEVQRSQGIHGTPSFELPEGYNLALYVRFHDELYRTDDPVLIAMRDRRRPRISVPATPFVVHEAPRLTVEQRQEIISRSIGTQAGRSRLAASMIAPIRQRLDYQSIGRRALMVEQMPEGAAPVYDRDPGVAQLLTRDIVGFRDAPAPLPMGGLVQSGFGAALSVVNDGRGGRILVTGLVGMGGSTGRYLRLEGPHDANVGLFFITEVRDAYSVWIENPRAVYDYEARYRWEEFMPPLAGIPVMSNPPQLGATLVFDGTRWVPSNGHAPDGTALPPPTPIPEPTLSRWAVLNREPPPPPRPIGAPSWARVLDESFLGDDE